MKRKIGSILIGMIIGIIFSSSIVFAANTSTSINVYFKNLKYMFDGIEQIPSTGKGFIYEGTTYVPLRFIGEALGKNIIWDGASETIWIGKKEGEFQYLSETEYARLDGVAKDKLSFDNWTEPVATFNISEVEYHHGIGIELDSTWRTDDSKGSIDYNLNDQYKRLTGFIGIDKATRNSDNIGTVIILGDGKEIYRATNLKGGDKPISLDINLKGVLKLQIKFESLEKTEILVDQQLKIVLGDLKVFQ